MECKNNPDFCGPGRCTLTPHNNKQDEQKASVTCELKKPVDDLKFRLTIFAKELQANMADIEEDFCAYMNGKNESKILPVLMPFIKNHSNINHPCPYTGAVNINELPLGSHLLASHDIPSGDYVLTISVVSNGIYITNTTTQLHIPEGKAVVAKP